MHNKVIVLVSFGTTMEAAAARSIKALAREAALRFADYDIREAYTSGMVMAALKKRGILVPSVPQLLSTLQQEGCGAVYLQPTHLLAGEEYEKLRRLAEPFASSFATLAIGLPLFGDMSDYKAVAAALANAYPLREAQALVLMGHGTSHPIQCSYPAFEHTLRELGLHHIYVGTLEGTPDRKDVLGKLQGKGYRELLLAPLLLVAGDHAHNDMVEDEDSWQRFFEEAGYTVTAKVQGLGELQRIREIYLTHIERLVNIDE